MMLSLVIAIFFNEFHFVHPSYLNVLPSAIFVVGIAYVVGNQIRRYVAIMNNYKYNLLLALIMLMSPIYTILLQHKMEMAGNTFGLDDYAIAFLATLGMLLLCTIIGHQKFLEYLGKNTFLILALHKTLIDFSLYYIQPYIQSHLIFKIVQFGFIWAICLILIPVINKHIPQLVGKH